jgi:hypothetical protein
MSSPSRDCVPGGGRAASAGVPTPGDQVILGEMLMQQRGVASAVTRPIFQLCANFAERFTFPGHLNRSQAPAGMSRDALIARSLTPRQSDGFTGMGVPLHPAAERFWRDCGYLR